MSPQLGKNSPPHFSTLLSARRASPEPETKPQDIMRNSATARQQHTTARSKYSPRSPPRHKHVRFHSKAGKYSSMSVPLPLRLSRLRHIPHKPILNPRLIEEHEQAQGYGDPSWSSFSSRNQDRHAQSNSLGISVVSAAGSAAGSTSYYSNDDPHETRRDREAEQPREGDFLYSCPSSSSSDFDNAPHDTDEIFIPPSPRPKPRTLPVQPQPSPYSSASSASSSSGQDASRGRRPFSRSRSYAQLPDSFSKRHDPFQRDDGPLASENKSRYKPGDTEDVSSKDGRLGERSGGEMDELLREYSAERHLASWEARSICTIITL
jgi:hypothetical protein